MNKFIQCVSNDNKNATPMQTIYAIKNAGFDGVFLQWYNKDWEFSQEKQLKLCKELDLEIPFVHLGYKYINNIWNEGQDGEILVKNYLNDLDVIKSYNINMVVMHLTSHSSAPTQSLIGIKRLQKIADYAQGLNIKIAFENTKIPGYLEYVFEHIKNSNIGLCYDAGHCHCHFDDKFNWGLFKNKVFALHLHDNDKSGDMHLLPFDGTIDWQHVMNNINQASYTGPIILESCYSENYSQISLEQFYKLSMQRAKKLAEINIIEN